jgi:hypothetical protein
MDALAPPSPIELLLLVTGPSITWGCFIGEGEGGAAAAAAAAGAAAGGGGDGDGMDAARGGGLPAC